MLRVVEPIYNVLVILSTRSSDIVDDLLHFLPIIQVLNMGHIFSKLVSINVHMQDLDPILD